MSNPWPYKNHQYGSNYSVVTVQEHFRKNQSNMRHPVGHVFDIDGGISQKKFRVAGSKFDDLSGSKHI